MSVFGSLTLEQVFVNLCRAHLGEGIYGNVNEAVQGWLSADKDSDLAELVREEHMELVQNVAEEMGVENIDDPEVYGPLLDLNCDHNEHLAKFIEETSE